MSHHQRSFLPEYAFDLYTIDLTSQGGRCYSSWPSKFVSARIPQCILRPRTSHPTFTPRIRPLSPNSGLIPTDCTFKHNARAEYY